VKGSLSQCEFNGAGFIGFACDVVVLFGIVRFALASTSFLFFKESKKVKGKKSITA